MMRKCVAATVACLVLLTAGLVHAQQKLFSETVGPVQVQPVKPGNVSCPFMTWGGDLPLFVANGNNLTTQQGSIYGKMGVNVTFYKQNDFAQQVRDYMSGKTPFLRGTYSSLALASEIVNSDPRTKPVVVLFISWSAGDHMISREQYKNLNDLRPKNGKKVRVAVQEGGAHVGWLYDILQTAQLTKDDVEIVWAKELAGDGSAADVFRKDASVDACFAITPDLIGLTGGMDKVGNGAEGTVKGAHVLVSTQQMSRAIPDVLAVRRDYYTANKATVEKIVAGYLAASEQVVQLRKGFEESHKLSPEYKAMLQLMQNSFGKDVVPTLEVDGHGLLLDCVFTGIAGQVSFFEDKGNLSGFDGQLKSTLDMAQAFGYVKSRKGFDPSGLNYQQIATLANIKFVAPDASKPRINAEAIGVFPDSANLDDRTIVSFTIAFEPNQDKFSADQYGAEFARALRSASSFGNAVVLVRGHSDPSQTLVDFCKAGMAKGILKRNGTKGNYNYFFNGKPLDLTQTGNIVAVIKSPEFDNADPNPRETMQAALNLSQSRAAAVKQAIVDMAKQQGITLDASQIQPVGAGIMEPVIAKPTNIDEAKQNMRVEFRIVKVPAEAIKSQDFDF